MGDTMPSKQDDGHFHKMRNMIFSWRSNLGCPRHGGKRSENPTNVTGDFCTCAGKCGRPARGIGDTMSSKQDDGDVEDAECDLLVEI